jgi:TatD DNase family protein
MEQKWTLVDTHAHLDFEELQNDLEGVIKRAGESGVKYIITVGGGKGIESNERAVEIAKKFPNVYATIGLHPDGADKFSQATEQLLNSIAGEKKVVAVGETGLDFKCDIPFETQKKCFEFQIDLARKYHLPLIIHARNAFKEVLKILRSYNRDSHSGVFHCFSGDREIARDILDLGFYISFTGIITFKNARELQDTVRYLPVERLLIETDSPFLSPEPFRGKINEPARVIYVAKKIAELKGLSEIDIARITSYNSKKLFGVGNVAQPGAIAYRIRDSLYLNVTNRCTNSCRFCPKFKDSYTVKGYDLKIENEPSAQEIIREIVEPSGYREVVFCGFGEPLLRLDTVKEVASWLKTKGVKIRIDTDGLANLVHGRNIVPELKGLVDSISVSLNAPDAQTYIKLCPSEFGEKAFNAVIEFLKEAKRHIPEVIATVVSVPNLDIPACKKIADELNVKFRVREYNSIG